MQCCPSVCNPQIIFPHHFQMFSHLDKGVRLKGRAEVCPHLCGVALPVQPCSWTSPSGFHLSYLNFSHMIFFLVLINAVLPFTYTQHAAEVTFLSQCFDCDTFLCNLYLVPSVHFKNKFLCKFWKLSNLYFPLVYHSLQRDWFHLSLPTFQMHRQKLCSSLPFCPHLSPCSQTWACIVTAWKIRWIRSVSAYW